MQPELPLSKCPRILMNNKSNFLKIRRLGGRIARLLAVAVLCELALGLLFRTKGIDSSIFGFPLSFFDSFWLDNQQPWYRGLDLAVFAINLLAIMVCLEIKAELKIINKTKEYWTKLVSLGEEGLPGFHTGPIYVDSVSGLGFLD